MAKNLIAAVLLAQAVSCNSPGFQPRSVLERPLDASVLRADTTADAVNSILSRDFLVLDTVLSKAPGLPIFKTAVRNTQISNKEPLGMAGVPKRFGEYFGYNQYEAILVRDNGFVPKPKSKGKPVIGASLGDFKEVKFPHVYYGLETEFPQSLRELARKDEKVARSLAGVRDFILIRKTSRGKTALAYYQGEKLFLATHVSTGKADRKTPPWLFASGFRQSYKKSSLYESAPMPYAIQVDGHIFLHHGRANGSPLSHGCIRVPGFYQEILFREIKSNTRILISI